MASMVLSVLRAIGGFLLVILGLVLGNAVAASVRDVSGRDRLRQATGGAS